MFGKIKKINLLRDAFRQEYEEFSLHEAHQVIIGNPLNFLTQYGDITRRRFHTLKYV